MAEEQSLYQMGENIGTFEEEMQKFMDAKVSEGVTYECNQDAYEDFKTYYDKKLKVAGCICGRISAMSRSARRLVSSAYKVGFKDSMAIMIEVQI